MNDTSAPPPAAPVPPDASADGNETARTAGRGGLAVAFAKIYFILTGLVQQIVLPRVLGLGGYGAWSTVNSIASMTYNPVLVMSIQGVSRAVAAAPPSEQRAALRRTLWVHGPLAVLLALGFFAAAPAITGFAGAPHVTGALAILSGAMLLYSLYGPLIGALNGQKRFVHQAAFDVFAATVRTIGLIAGAYFLVGRGYPVEGAASGFVLGLVLVFGLALAVVGVGRAGPGGPSIGQHVAFLVPVLIGQALLNLLLQADLTLLRRFSAEAALAAGLPITAADPLVGAYRATQLFSFLPYQLLMAVNFVLFPMLATAVREGDRAAVARYVSTGVRLALVLAGAMVSVTAGLSEALIRLVYGQEAAELGGRSLEVLALGFGAFAIFGVLTTVLNSLKRERSSALATLVAVVVVAVLCFARVRGSDFGEILLFRTASATSAGLAVATLTTAFLVRRRAGTVVAITTVVRVLAAVAAAVALGRFLPARGALLTIGSAALVGLVYLGLLVVTREIGKADLVLIRTVIARRRS